MDNIVYVQHGTALTRLSDDGDEITFEPLYHLCHKEECIDRPN